MMGVTPRIVIQEEEEEKLGIADDFDFQHRVRPGEDYGAGRGLPHGYGKAAKYAQSRGTPENRLTTNSSAIPAAEKKAGRTVRYPQRGPREHEHNRRRLRCALSWPQ